MKICDTLWWRYIDLSQGLARIAYLRDTDITRIRSQKVGQVRPEKQKVKPDVG